MVGDQQILTKLSKQSFVSYSRIVDKTLEMIWDPKIWVTLLIYNLLILWAQENDFMPRLDDLNRKFSLKSQHSKTDN